MKKFDEKIYFKQDIINEYHKRRKNFPKEEIEDLLNCIVKFLKEDIQEENQYAYHLPFIGTLYKSIWDELETKSEKGSKMKRFDQQLLDVMLNDNSNVVTRPSRLEVKYPGKTLEEIQELNNAE